MQTIDMENRNGTFHAALTTRDAWRRRIQSTRKIVSVRIPELDDPDDAEQPEGWVLMRAMTGSRREAWSIRQLAEQRYEPDEELRKERERERTYGQLLQGNKESLVANSVVDEEGALIWSDFDAAEIGEANSAALERLYAKAVQLNGLPRANLPPHLLAWLEADEAGAGAAPVPLGDRAKNLPADRTPPSSSN